MAKHFIFEIDEGSLSLAVAEVRRKKIQVLLHRRVALPSMEGSALVFAMHDVLKDQDKDGAFVHVVLSDPNFLHFDLQLPRLEFTDLKTVMKREARRLGSVPDEDQVLLGARQLEKIGRGAWRHAVVALPENSLRPIKDALKREGLEIHSLTSVEEAAVRLLPRSLPDATLFLGHGAGRIRFVYLERGVITQRRHILAPGLDDQGGGPENGFWIDQLSMEMGWNLDYLGDMGKARPESIVLSTDLDLSEEQVEKIRGELPLLEAAPPLFESPEGNLTQSTQGILHGLVAGGAISIFGVRGGPRRLDKKLVLWTSLSACLSLVLLAGSGWVMQRGAEIQERIQEDRSRLQDLRSEREGIAEDLDAIEAREERARLRAVLGSRRPLSLLLAEFCKNVPTGIHLAEMSVKPDGALYVRGRASGLDRLGSLDLVKAYRESLQKLEFLVEVRERVERFEGEEAWLDFLILARWRQDG